MESPMGFTLLFASLLLFSFSHSPTTVASTQLLETVCNQTTNNSECLKFLKADPRTETASNYTELAPFAYDLATTYAKGKEAFVKGLNKTYPSETIATCADAYNNMAGQFQAAKKDIFEDPSFADYDIKLAYESVMRCDDALKGLHIPAVSAINQLMYLYANIGIIIADHVILL